MMGSQDSCLVQKLSHYLDLRDAERSHIAQMEKEKRSYSRGETVQSENDAGSALSVVQTGWLFGYSILADGRRQVLRVYHPGDIIGFPDIAFSNATIAIDAAEDCVLCPFPKSHLDVITKTSPRLTALLFTIALRDQVVLMDLVRATGRMSARERLAYFILDTLAHSRVFDLTQSEIRVPLSQSVIGDMLGLTPAYVSRSLSQIEADGLIERQRNGVLRVKDEETLRDLCDFSDRYAAVDLSWFPD